MAEKLYNGLVIGDVHICERNPICRADDIRKTQIAKMDAIAAIANEKKAPLFIVGDLYDRWQVGFRLVHEVNTHLLAPVKLGVYGIAGNHDLPGHNINRMGDSPLVLAPISWVWDGLWCNELSAAYSHYGVDLCEEPADVAFEHRMVFLDNPIDGYNGKQYDVRWLINQPLYSNKRLIFTGHAHKGFCFKNADGRMWVNTGPIMRTSITDKYCEPSVWYFEITKTKCEVWKIALPVNVDAVDRLELYIDKAKDTMVSEFAAGIKAQEAVVGDYKAIVTRLVAKADDPQVEKAVWMAVEDETLV